MLIIGSHVNFNKNQLLGSAMQAVSYGANTFMFYTGAPQNTVRSAIDSNLTNEAWKYMKENNIDINNVICHAPYIVNLANDTCTDKHKFGISFISQELKRCDELNVKYLVLHPGSAVNVSREEALLNIAAGLNSIFESDYNCSICLETMAGKGNECGKSISELKTIYDNVTRKDKIYFCLDTCHLNDAGYSISEFDKYLEDFDTSIGINKIKCIHVNDSKNDIASHKDRHENIGFGKIGFDNLINVIYNEKLLDVPKILETPYVDGNVSREYPPYKYEIEMIKNKKFDPKMIDKIKNIEIK